MKNIPFITTNQALAEYCQRLRSASLIAMDTEFLRYRTFYPKPGLFQVNDGSSIALIDPCVITEWEDFKAILSDPSIIKVFHACDEDIELLNHFLGVTPRSVFDTQVAAALCGYDYSMGYQRLIKAMLDVDLEKSSSRSDWMQRPLSDEQLHYAADDVRYLPAVYQQLSQQLAVRGLLHVVEEEYEAVLATINTNDFDNAYMRIKQAWKLDEHELAILKVLAKWREQMMRTRDMPRNKIATNEALVILATRKQLGFSQLFGIEGLPAATVKSSGEQLLSLIHEASLSPDLSGRIARPVKQDEIMDSLKSILQGIARQHGMAEQMLSKKSFNEEMYRMIKKSDFSVPESIKGWRRGYYEQAASMLKV